MLHFLFNVFGSDEFMAQDYTNDLHINSGNDALFSSILSFNTTSFCGDLIIEDNSSVNITNGVLQFCEGSRIIIMPGSKLDCDGLEFKLTNYAGNGGETWSGVEVRGNPLAPAIPSQQGKFTLKLGVLENALVGASNYNKTESLGLPSTSGGIIQMQSAFIRNCYQAIVLAKYNFPVNSSFKYVQFMWNNSTPFTEEQQRNPMFHIHGNYTVPISNCSFINTNTDIFYPDTHIDRSAIFVNGNGAMVFENNSIDGFVYGTVIWSPSSSQVLYNDYACYRSIYLLGNNNSRIRNCNIIGMSDTYINSIGPVAAPQNLTQSQTVDNQYGIYLENCTGYQVIHNDIKFPSNEERENGIFVNGSGANSNIIEQNTISHCGGRAIVSLESNRSTGGVFGLKLECNILSQNFGGIEASSNGSFIDSKGMAAVQGVAPFQISSGTSAGNLFSGNAGVFNDMDVTNGFHVWNKDQEVGHVDYYYSNLDGLTEADGDITTITNNISANNECPFFFATNTGDYKDEANLHKEFINTYSTQLQNVIDGGDTDALTLDVILTNFTEAVNLYYNLMAKSPNLSEKVMIETINKEAEIPAALLTLILKSNPLAAKSASIKEKLDDRMTPLTEYQRYMINQGINLVSEKQNLEALIAFHQNEYESLLNSGIMMIIKEDSLGLSTGLIENFIEGNERISDHYLLADLYLQKNDLISAYNWLESIPNNFELKERRLEDYNDFVICYSIRNMTNTNIPISDSDISSLETILFKDLGRAKGMAKILLDKHTAYLHSEYTSDVNLEQSAFTNRSYLKPKHVASLRIYPNPATDYIIIETLNSDNVVFTLTDGCGKLVKKIVARNNSQIIIDLRDLNSGQYLLTYSDQSGGTKSEKLEIIK